MLAQNCYCFSNTGYLVVDLFYMYHFEEIRPCHEITNKSLFCLCSGSFKMQIFYADKMYSQEDVILFIIQGIKRLLYMKSKQSGYPPFSFIFNSSVSTLMRKLSEICSSSRKSNVSKVTFSRFGVTMHITWAKPRREPHKVNVLLQMTISVSLCKWRQCHSGCKSGRITHFNFTHLDLQTWNNYSYKNISVM